MTQETYSTAATLEATTAALLALEHFIEWWDEWCESDDPTNVGDPDVDGCREIAATARRLVGPRAGG